MSRSTSLLTNVLTKTCFNWRWVDCGVVSPVEGTRDWHDPADRLTTEPGLVAAWRLQRHAVSQWETAARGV